MGTIRCLGLAFVLLGCMAAENANATAIAGSITNTFTVLPAPAVGSIDGVFVSNPSGIVLGIDSSTVSTSISVFDSASINFSEEFSGTGATLRGSAVANPGGHASGTKILVVTLFFTNLSGFDFDSVVFLTDFSAFNPGGSQVGAKVDDINLEFARFTSSQSGPGIGDSHSCDTRMPGGSYFQFVPPNGVECGVTSPDSSQGDFTLLNFDNGETLRQTFTLSLDLEVNSALPEPATIAMLIAGLLGLAGLKRVASRHAGR